MDHLDVTPDRLVGTWHIVCSSFPMWLGGSRTEATFTYRPLPPGRSGAARLRDEVGYRSRGRRRTIRGVDTRLTDRPGTVFRWRGHGPLALLSSEWEVSEFGPDDAWAVITFNRSLVTPAGTDVVVRADRFGDTGTLGAALAAGDRLGASRLPGFESLDGRTA